MVREEIRRRHNIHATNARRPRGTNRAGEAVTPIAPRVDEVAEYPVIRDMATHFAETDPLRQVNVTMTDVVISALLVAISTQP